MEENQPIEYTTKFIAEAHTEFRGLTSIELGENYLEAVKLFQTLPSQTKVNSVLLTTNFVNGIYVNIDVTQYFHFPRPFLPEKLYEEIVRFAKSEFPQHF